jgi:hypothetical protein
MTISYITIFLATCVGFLVGWAWYSPLMFMNLWLTGKGITKDKLPKRSSMYLVKTNLYSFIAHFCMSMTLAVLFSLLSVTSPFVAVSVGAMLAFGFIVSSRFVDMMYTVEGEHYDKRNQIHFLVNSSYYVVTVSVMAYMLVTLPLL